MTKDESFYTELIYRHKSLEDFGAREIAIHEPAWDLRGDDYIDMFHTIFIGASFSEEQWKQALISHLWGEYGIEVKEPDENEDEDDNT